ncbi:MAG: helix-turn-helix transcriptional regulator [Dehalococcoidia bacterium]|nr:helix-turn-helix transcriptional regulator [Dehalococcoidia bacterium]
MKFSKDQYLKLQAPDGDYRYGYVVEVLDGGWGVLVSMREEGESKIEFDAAQGIPRPQLCSFTDAEKRLLPLLAEHCKPNDIAAQLSLSPITIRSQVRTILNKLSLQSHAQLCTYAEGIVKREPCVNN